MRTIFRTLGFLPALTLVPGLVPPVRGADVPPPVRGVTDFHHAEWSGLGAVFDIKQSSEGYLWLKTSKGVLRFDGVRFQSVDEVTRGAVRDGDIDSVSLSPSGGLWMATEGAGLLFWKDGRLTTFPDRRCTPARRRGKLIEDRDGSLWVQATAGLFRLHESACQQLGPEQGYPGGAAAGILMDSDGTLWVKTRKGRLLFLPRGQSKFQLSQYGEGVTADYAFLHQAADGTIWLSDEQGLRRAANKLSAAVPLPIGKGDRANNQFGDFMFAPDGSLWAVTGRGVQRFDHVERWPTPVAVASAPGESFTPEEGLSSDAVWEFLIDREETVWVGTNAGLEQLRRAAFTTVVLPRAPEHEYSIAAGGNGSVWTGNSSLPLTHVAADGVRTSYPRTRQTVTVHRDRTGAIWSAGAGDFRLWKSSGGDLSPLHYPDDTLDPAAFIAVDRNQNPWITTNSGRAWHFSGGAWHNETGNLGKRPGVVGAMADDEAGNVWFAFSNKVVQWDGSTYNRFSFPDGERGVSENTMSVQGEHVWLGGAGGVQLFTGGRFRILRWKDRDLPGRVSGVVETGSGDLWVNGFSGIAHVSSAELKKWLGEPNYAVAAEHLDGNDGLPGLSEETRPQPSVIEAPDGRLWFATTRGIAWLSPAVERKPNRLPPPVVISAVVSDGKTFAGASGLNLPAGTANLEIDYTALSLAVPDRVLFRYKLDGVDRDWQNVGKRREAYYTKLHPGRYRFRVIACNNDGVWNEAGSTLNFSVEPAWFQTTWFFLLSIAFGVCVVTASYRFRVRQIAAAMNARFDERLAERTRIAQELHDTLLQGFLSASMHVHVATDRLQPDSPVKPILTRAIQLMSQVIEEGRNAIRGLRSAHGASLNLEQSFARIQQEIGPVTQGKEVGFRVIAEGEHRPLHPLLRDEVYRIGREALVNAFRHAKASEIEVTLTYMPDQLRLLVRDDGCGIDPNVLSSGRDGHWGLSGMRERADRIRARLRVMSSATAGTEIELSIPGYVAFQEASSSKASAGRKA